MLCLRPINFLTPCWQIWQNSSLEIFKKLIETFLFWGTKIELGPNLQDENCILIHEKQKSPKGQNDSEVLLVHILSMSVLWHECPPEY